MFPTINIPILVVVVLSQLTGFGSTTKCGMEIGGFHNGTLSSPGYPTNYNPLTYCPYRISVKAGMNIKLTFIEVDFPKLKAEEVDFLFIYEGDSCFSKLVTMVGSLPTAPIVINGNSVALLFLSDSFLQGRGFSLKYEAVAADIPATVMKPSTSPKQLKPCGNEVNGQNGTIKTPAYPQNYPLNAFCLWRINGDPFKSVQLKISDIKLEQNADWVRVLGGSTCMAHEILYMKEDTMASNLIIDQANVVVLFYSDSTGQSTGFQLEYEQFIRQTTPTPTTSFPTDSATPSQPVTEAQRLTIYICLGILILLIIIVIITATICCIKKKKAKEAQRAV